jgi:uncharacterized protein (TIGR00730 family)
VVVSELVHGPEEIAEGAAPPGGEGEAGGGATAGPPRWGKRTESPEERHFLQGPDSRLTELRRLFRIGLDFLRGFRTLHFVGPCVTVFGSARFAEDHRYYALAREAGRRLGLAGFTVMTGGGPGIMEAANRGAKDVGAPSVGCNIVLPEEQKHNPFLDLFVEFRYFFVRKVMLVKYSYAFVVLPGGFGTMDEIFECATLIQTGKIRNFPLVLIGVDYWTPLMVLLRGTMVPEKTIAAADVDRILLTDSVDEAMEHIVAAATGEFGLVLEPKDKPRWYLGETRTVPASTHPAARLPTR